MYINDMLLKFADAVSGGNAVWGMGISFGVTTNTALPRRGKTAAGSCPERRGR